MPERQVGQNTPFEVWEELLSERDVVVSVQDLGGGLDTDTPMPLLPNGFAPEIDGFIVRRGQVETDWGTDAISVDTAGLPGESAKGNGYKYLIYAEFVQVDNVQLMLTDKSLYYVDSNDQWALVQLNGAPEGTGITLDGRPSIPPTWTIDTALNRVIFTNGVDTPFYFDGTDVRFISALATEFTSFTARVVAFWNNLLIFCDTTEGGTRRPYRMRNSDASDIDEWDAGVAGFIDFLDVSEAIITTKSLGQFLILYREHSIIRCSYEGSALRLIDTRTVISADGPRAPQLVLQLYDQHVFVGQYGVYRYLGEFAVQELSQRIEDFLQEQVRITELWQISSFVDFSRRIIAFLFPKAATDTVPARTSALLLYLPLDVREPPVWSKRTFDFFVDTAGTFSIAPTGVGWNDLAGQNWLSLGNDTWNSKTASARAEIRHTLTEYKGDTETVAYHRGAALDASADAREWVYTTRRHYISDRDIQLQSLFLLYESQHTLIVDVIGTGETLEFEPTMGEPANSIRYRNMTAPHLQFKIRGRGSAKILGYGFSYSQSGYSVENAS